MDLIFLGISIYNLNTISHYELVVHGSLVPKREDKHPSATGRNFI